MEGSTWLSVGSYFPSQSGKDGQENWPLGDESTWKTAIKAEELDPEDVQGVANTVVRHVSTTLARQAANMDTVSQPSRCELIEARGISSYCSVCPRSAIEAVERHSKVSMLKRPR